jgi:hypothetical protein
MPITTDEFEERLNSLLTRMEEWEKCEWCGCNSIQRRAEAKSKLCNSCKGWRRKERQAEEWIKDHPDRVAANEFMGVEYDIEYAKLCREEGQICSWKGPISTLDLETELVSISKRFCGENVFGDLTYYFQYFSDGQRRLLMFLFEELTKVYIRNHRRGYAIEKALDRVLPSRKGL